jgi:hypothetical protein
MPPPPAMHGTPWVGEAESSGFVLGSWTGIGFRHYACMHACILIYHKRPDRIAMSSLLASSTGRVCCHPPAAHVHVRNCRLDSC